MKKKDLKLLKDVLHRLEVGIKYLTNEKIAVMVKADRGATNFFESKFYPGQTYYPLNKDIGSDLVQLYNAKRILTNFLLFEENTIDYKNFKKAIGRTEPTAQKAWKDFQTYQSDAGTVSEKFESWMRNRLQLFND